jgi:NADPH2:quinone reductase
MVWMSLSTALANLLWALRSRAPEGKAEILSRIVREVYPKIESGEVKPTIYKVQPITEEEKGHDLFCPAESVGKIV